MDASQSSKPKKRRIDQSPQEAPEDPYAEYSNDLDLSRIDRAHGTISKPSFLIALLMSVAKSCTTNPVEHGYSCQFFRNPTGPQIPIDEDTDVSITNMVTKHEAEVLARLSMLLERFPEETAWCHEIVETSWPDASQFGEPRKELDGSSRLECFRKAQKIRDEYGITRERPTSRCFNSFEDISKLEENVSNGESVDYLIHCILLHDYLPVETIYEFVDAHAQLKSLHQEVTFLDRYEAKCERAYAWCFDDLAKFRVEDAQLYLSPTWCQLKFYLATSDYISLHHLGEMFDAEIPNHKLDEALSDLLAHLISCFESHQPRVMPDYPTMDETLGPSLEAAVNALLLLLDKGANLEFREEHDILQRERSSLGALIELNDLIFEFPLTKFFQHICCPLTVQRPFIDFDKFRPARLLCLAARNVGPLRNYSQVPNSLRLWIRMHQDLRVQLDNTILRIAMVQRRLRDVSLLIIDR